MNTRTRRMQELTALVAILSCSNAAFANQTAITNALKSSIEKGVVVQQSGIVSASSLNVSAQSTDGG